MKIFEVEIIKPQFRAPDDNITKLQLMMTSLHKQAVSFFHIALYLSLYSQKVLAKS